MAWALGAVVALALCVALRLARRYLLRGVRRVYPCCVCGGRSWSVGPLCRVCLRAYDAGTLGFGECRCAECCAARAALSREICAGLLGVACLDKVTVRAVRGGVPYGQ
jgi:hypothetical protein